MKSLTKIISTLFIVFYANIVFAGGFIIVSPPGQNTLISNRFNPYTLEVRSLKVDVNIFNLFAKTTIEEVFYNPSSVNLQGWFLFPVPKGAVIKDFTMEINGKKMQAELLDAESAKKIYEDIVRQMQDPALLEYHGQELFKVRIFPIEAHKEKKITISYTQILDFDNNATQYTFPLNTEKYSVKPLKNISINVDIKSDKNITTLYSPTYETVINKSDKKNAKITFNKKEVKPDKDFLLFIGYSAQNVGLSVMTFTENDTTNGFFFMNISPAFVDKSDELVKKNITFIIDVSGSMAGEKLDKAKAALIYCISNLNSTDKFEIVKFSTFANSLFGKQVIANKKNTETALNFINNLKPVGGTNVQDAFSKAFASNTSQIGLETIIFITDGKPTIGETDNSKLLKLINEKNNSKNRIFTFGIGNDINTHLLDKITNSTNAFRTYISENEDIELKISNFFSKISYPVLSDIEISINGKTKISDYYPHKIPDLFKGSSVNILGRFDKNSESKLVITGKVNGNIRKFEYKISFETNTDNDFISLLWATRKVGFLLDQIRLNGENKELSDEVVRLAKRYGIITPYTSFLILEDEKIVSSNQTPPIFRGVNAEASDELYSRSKKEYSNSKSQSGSGSIQAGNEYQTMANVDKVYNTNQGANRMVYKDKFGNKSNFEDLVINQKGKVFYRENNNYTGVSFGENTFETVKVSFASKEYFKLLNSDAQLSKYLSLSKNIKFVHNNISYIITD